MAKNKLSNFDLAMFNRSKGGQPTPPGPGPEPEPVEVTGAVLFKSDKPFSIYKPDFIKSWEGTLEWSLDNIEWNEFTPLDYTPASTEIYLRGMNNSTINHGPATSTSSIMYNFEDESSYIRCYGLVTNLLDYRTPNPTTLAPYCFESLFKEWTMLKKAPDFPDYAIDVPEYGFSYMFDGCRSLDFKSDGFVKMNSFTTRYSCNFMFRNCISLTKVPEILTDIFTNNCCFSMFINCESLKYTPTFSVTTTSGSSFQSMFENCKNLKYIRISFNETANVSHGSAAFSKMFKGCISLETAPNIVFAGSGTAQNMFEGCIKLKTVESITFKNVGSTTMNTCNEMFKGCIKLERTPVFKGSFANTLPSSAFKGAFQNCISLTYASLPSFSNLGNGCFQNMFQNCISLETAPRLRNDTLISNCYNSMFKGCTQLKHIPALPATTLKSGCYTSMFENCTSLKFSETEGPGYSGGTYAIPHSGTITGSTTGMMSNMILGTSGEVQGLEVNKTYYLGDDNSVVV